MQLTLVRSALQYPAELDGIEITPCEVFVVFLLKQTAILLEICALERRDSVQRGLRWLQVLTENFGLSPEAIANLLSAVLEVLIGANEAIYLK